MRGNAKFETMGKGFGLELKGGTDLETMPPDPGKDVAEDEALDNKANGGAPKKGAIRTEEDDITMAKDVNLVNEGSKRDVADSYTQDCVREGKGYKAYNEMVTKGIAVDVSLDSHNILKGLDAIEEHTSGVVGKELGSGVTVKTPWTEPIKEAVVHSLGNAGKHSDVFGGGGVVRAARVGYNKAKNAVGGALGKVGGVVPGRNAAQEALRSGTYKVPGSVKNRLRRGAADVLASKKKVGAGVVGAGAIGAGAGANKLLDSEEKCAPAMNIKKKGVADVAKNVARRAGEKADVAGKKIASQLTSLAGQPGGLKNTAKNSLAKAGGAMYRNPRKTLAGTAAVGAAGVGGAAYGAKKATEDKED